MGDTAWQRYTLTHREAVTALRAASIDPDCDTWDAATLERAATVLDEAAKKKAERMHFGRRGSVRGNIGFK
jgi:hypothetical protein